MRAITLSRMPVALFSTVNLPPRQSEPSAPVLGSCGMAHRVASDSRRSRPLVLVLLLTLLLSGVWCSGAPGFRLQGLWTVNWPKRAHHFLDQPFEVYQSQGRYLVAAESRVPYAYHYTISTCDGVDSYFIDHPRSLRQPGQLAPLHQSQTMSVGQIHPGIFPTNQTTRMQLIWMAYLFPFQSQIPLLVEGEQLRIPLGAVVRDEWSAPEDFVVAALETHPTDPRIPQSFRIYHPGSGIKKGTTTQYYFPDPIYTNKWLRAEYEATDFTSYSGVPLPQRVSYREFLPLSDRDPTSSDDVDLIMHQSFIVTALGPWDELPAELPFTTSFTVVGDQRIMRADGSHHSIHVGHNGEIVRRDSPEFATMVQSVRREERKATRSRYLFPVLVLVLFVPVLGFAVARTRKRLVGN